ncbi:MAG: OsmC family protein [Beijerinckiaceae bacterium]|nr:OsmC family protein [Beijerinckiaceae bacterium]
MAESVKQVSQDTESALRDSPELGQARFDEATCLGDGLENTASIRKCSVNTCEPPIVEGTDTAPNTAELVLSSLGSCQEISYELYAGQPGIPLINTPV